jgi:DNA (cytosine-5)-methyltransferase 1
VDVAEHGGGGAGVSGPTFGSLFSGIGGLDLGLERAGWRCAFQIENDPYCQRVLAKHWPDVPRWGDIREVTPDDLPRVDLLAGGFPCQPVSSAGGKRGTADDGWLWPEFARLIRVVRPRLVLVENVPGLLYRTGGMGVVLGDLATCGYDAEWDCLPAAAVGAPHLRDRVWIVGYPHDEGQSVRPFDAEVAVLSAVGDTHGAPADACPSGRRSRSGVSQSTWWDTEPPLDRVAHGIPARVDRLRGLGNAVVPQVAEWLGHRLMEACNV